MTDKTMAEKMIANLEKNTGKPLAHWIEVVKQSGLEKHGGMIKFLKEEHGFTHGFANLVAHKARQSDARSAENTDVLVDNQYSGKENLRPIYDALIAQVQKFGADIEIAPKKTYVSLRRKKQFALVQPSTKTRVDVGLNLKGVDPDGVLEESGSFNSMCTHRVRVTSEEDVNTQLIDWLKEAYEHA